MLRIENLKFSLGSQQCNKDIPFTAEAQSTQRLRRGEERNKSKELIFSAFSPRALRRCGELALDDRSLGFSQSLTF